MKKNIFKRLLSIFMIFTLNFSLISILGCSSTTKEKEVFNEIKKQDIYCSSFDFTYDSMKIVKRMTDEEEKTDTIWVDFTCHNDDFEYKVECMVKYILYNEGWIFENYEILKSSYTALKKPTTKTVIKDFSYIEFASVKEWEIYEQGAEYSEEIVDQNKYVFIGYSKDKISEYFTWDVTDCITYQFTPEEGWVGEIQNLYREENWNWNAFIGRWKTDYLLLSDLYNLNINKIDKESVSADYFKEKWNGEFEKFSGNFEIKYVTGTKYYPNDIPVYKAYFNFGFAGYGLDVTGNISFTPYGIYSFFPEDANGNHVLDDKYKYIKVS